MDTIRLTGNAVFSVSMFQQGRAENKAGSMKEREIAAWLTWCIQERRSGSLKRGVKARAKRAAGARRDSRQKDKTEAALSIQKSETTSTTAEVFKHRFQKDS